MHFVLIGILEEHSIAGGNPWRFCNNVALVPPDIAPSVTVIGRERVVIWALNSVEIQPVLVAPHEIGQSGVHIN